MALEDKTLTVEKLSEGIRLYMFKNELFTLPENSPFVSVKFVRDLTNWIHSPENTLVQLQRVLQSAGITTPPYVSLEETVTKLKNEMRNNYDSFLMGLTIKDLKKILANNELKVSGNKEELIERLIEYVGLSRRVAPKGDSRLKKLNNVQQENSNNSTTNTLLQNRIDLTNQNEMISTRCNPNSIDLENAYLSADPFAMITNMAAPAPNPKPTLNLFDEQQLSKKRRLVSSNDFQMKHSKDAQITANNIDEEGGNYVYFNKHGQPIPINSPSFPHASFNTYDLPSVRNTTSNTTSSQVSPSDEHLQTTPNHPIFWVDTVMSATGSALGSGVSSSVVEGQQEKFVLRSLQMDVKRKYEKRIESIEKKAVAEREQLELQCAQFACQFSTNSVELNQDLLQFSKSYDELFNRIETQLASEKKELVHKQEQELHYIMTHWKKLESVDAPSLAGRLVKLKSGLNRKEESSLLRELHLKMELEKIAQEKVAIDEEKNFLMQVEAKLIPLTTSTLASSSPSGSASSVAHQL